MCFTKSKKKKKLDEAKDLLSLGYVTGNCVYIDNIGCVSD